jgi:hypothetical protein
MERIKELNYNMTLIKRELARIADKPLIKKIIELINQKISCLMPVDLKTAKNCLKEVYEILSIDKSAKASDLKKYFIVHEFSRTIDNRVIRYIELIREKTGLSDQE